MSLSVVLKERQEKKKRELRQAAFSEAKRLASLLRKRFEFESVYLWGSLLTEKFSRHSDIDLVVKGLRVKDFFKAHALLIKESAFEIDLKPFEEMSEDIKEKVLQGGQKIG